MLLLQFIEQQGKDLPWKLNVQASQHLDDIRRYSYGSVEVAAWLELKYRLTDVFNPFELLARRATSVGSSPESD